MIIQIGVNRLSRLTDIIAQAFGDLGKRVLENVVDLEENIENILRRTSSINVKRYSMLFRKTHRYNRVSSNNYNYLPKAKRNLPYQKRVYQ